MSASSDAIKQIIAANKKDIDTYKAQNKRVKKSPTASTFHPDMMSDSWFETQTQRTQQQVNPSAMLGTTAAPMAPPSTARQPINMPQSSGGIFQGAVAQINQAAAQLGIPQSPIKAGGFSPILAAQIQKMASAGKVSFGNIPPAQPQAPQKSGSGNAPNNPQAINNQGGAQNNAPQRNQDQAFAMSRIYHSLRSISRIGREGRPWWNAHDQIGPISSVLNQVADSAGLMPEPYGAIAIVSALAVKSGMAIWEWNDEKRGAKTARNFARRDFMNPNLAAQIHRDEQKNRNSYEGRNLFEKYLHFMGDSVPASEATRQEIEKMAAMKGMREHGYLYGGKASKALAQYAAKNNLPINEISELVVNEIVDAVHEAKRRDISKTPQFQKALRSRLPWFEWGTGDVLHMLAFGTHSDEVVRRHTEKFLNDIEINPQEAVKFGFDVLLNDRGNADMKVAKFKKDNKDFFHTIEETNRNIQLKTQAERHRHLAEW